MNVQALYERWMAQDLEDLDLKPELLQIEGDKDQIFDRFYRELDFGTAGLRGVLGAGTNRMNIYTVRKATQGLADYLNESEKAPSVAIAYDSRIKSDLFAKEAACVLAANGIKTFIYAELMPTPALSFAVRELKTTAGIVVTASHNPAKYNGYKVYGSDGCQIGPEVASAVLGKIGKVDIFDGVKTICLEDALQKGLVEYIPEEVIQRFLNCVLAQQVNPGICKDAGLKVVYTPLNGAGRRCVTTVLEKMGVTDVTVVPEQEYPDGHFPTCPFPNPEIQEALELGLKLCEATGADLLLATDPDCDRVGIAVKAADGYKLLTGNEVGVLLLNYIASCRLQNGTMPQNPVVVKSIVTTPMVHAVAKDYGVEVVDVLTGFKFIGEYIYSLEQKGEEERYLLGFEESYGYLSGSYVRDKDAVNGSMLIVEMMAYYKTRGKALAEVLEGLYRKYGIYRSIVNNFVFEGADGMKKMADMMESLRQNPISELGGFRVVSTGDYQRSTRVQEGKTSEILLPKSNVLEYELENKTTVIVRPSGTEPKIKVYYSIVGKDETQVKEVFDAVSVDVNRTLGVS